MKEKRQKIFRRRPTMTNTDSHRVGTAELHHLVPDSISLCSPRNSAGFSLRTHIGMSHESPRTPLSQ